MKKFTNILFAWLLAVVMCFGSMGNLAVADDTQATLGEAGEFNGVHVKATSALTDYRKIASGNFTIDVAGKALAVRFNLKTLGLANTQIEPKLVVNDEWKGANGKTVYLVPGAGQVTPYAVPWSVGFDSTFNGWIVFPSDAFGTVAQGSTVSFFFGVHNEWTGLPDFVVGDIVAFDMPADISNSASFKTAIAAGTTAYSFAGTELNAANVYDFGEDAVTITRVYLDGEQEKTVDGYFNGLNFKIETKLTDYAKIQLPTTDAMNITGKALAIRMRKMDNEVGSIDLKPDVFGVTDWFLNETDWSLTESSFWWCIDPVKNFNGWVILTFKEDAVFTGGMWFGFADWSKNANIDLGTIALIDLPETKDYDSFKTALESKTVVYEFATDKALNENTTYEGMPEEGVSFTRVVASLEVEPKPLDGYFKGANVKFEDLLGESDYFSVGLPKVDVENIMSKAFALRVNVRGGNGEVDINFANFSLDIGPNSGVKYYAMDAKGTTVAEKESWWALTMDNGFNGWLIMPFAQWNGTYESSNINLSFGAWSGKLDIDFGTAAFITMPETADAASLTAALESKELICECEPILFASLPKSKVATQRVAETLSLDNAQKAPAYCSIIGDTKVMNFQLGEDDLITDLVGDAAGYPVSEFSTTNRGTEEDPNTALHVKLGTSLENFPHSAIEVRLKGYGNKIESTAKGLTFYVKNYQSQAFHINIGFDAGHRWYTKWSGEFASYQLYNTATGEESVNIGGYEGLYIPANFEGYVRVSFMQFVPANWVAAILDWEDAITNPVSYLSIDVNTDMYAGFEFDIDDIGWYYGEAQTKNMFISGTEGAKTIAQLMAEADYFAE